MKKFIKGYFTRIIFKSDNNFIIGLMKVQDTNDNDMIDFVNKTITFTGIFHELNIDEKYIFYGELINNIKYGLQYNVTEYERVKPEDIDSIIDFLSSDLFHKVGVKTAKNIVDVLKEDTLKLIEEDYSNLLLVPNMKEEKAKYIHDTLIKYNESYETILFLTKIGFNMKDSMDIFNTLKTKTKTIINNNIYELIDMVDSISFLKVEKVRKNLDIKDDNKYRILACIIHVFKNYCFNTGDTYAYLSDLYLQVSSYLQIEDFSLEDLSLYLSNLKSLGKIITEDDKYFLFEYYSSENNIASTLSYFNNKKDNKYKSILNEITKLELDFKIIFNKKQKEAIKKALEKNFVIITGSPGTGKTTIIKGIVELYKRLNRLNYMDLENKLALLSPTGRAAKRMSEGTNFKASTIHRFLKWNKETDTFLVNKDNKSTVEFVIIDEASMIDVNLFNSLLNGLSKNVKLVLIGDYNQLESVGPGNILKDLIDSNKLNVIKLDELYRQEENSYINILAKEINDDNLTYDFNSKRKDFSFISSEKYNVKKYIKEVIIKALDKGYTLNDIQVLCPMYKGYNGIDNLNKYIQELLNKDEEKSIKYLDVVYKKNDKVLQLENDPNNNVFNGDIGYIIDIDKNVVTIDFDGNVVKYTSKDLNMIKHAYAISIHKAQGSEFNIVIIPIVSEYRIMLYKKLIYTGITRAKKSLILIGEKDAFIYSIKNNNLKERRTILKDKLIECIN